MTAYQETPAIEDAQEFTDALRQLFSGTGEILDSSYRFTADGIKRGIPKALGVSNAEWARSVAPSRKYEAVERQRIVAELLAEEMSQREIAAVVGVDPATVNRDVANATGRTNEPSNGADSVGASVANATQNLATVNLDTGEILDDDEDEWWDDTPGEADPSMPEKPHVAHNSGENEWYTPPEYIAAAREVMGGIDLDPASSPIANRTVQATEFYTAAENGLVRPWRGCVWLNPPYAQPLIQQFADKLVDEWLADHVDQAMVLVNNATETAWFQTMAKNSSAIAFPRGRVRFLDEAGNPGAPLQGQAVLYFGELREVFQRTFERFGVVR